MMRLSTIGARAFICEPEPSTRMSERPDRTGGVVFFRTERRERVVEWYTDVVGADVWLEQPGCTVLTFEGFRFGFCDAEETETAGILAWLRARREARRRRPRC